MMLDVKGPMRAAQKMVTKLKGKYKEVTIGINESQATSREQYLKISQNLLVLNPIIQIYL